LLAMTPLRMVSSLSAEISMMIILINTKSTTLDHGATGVAGKKPIPRSSSAVARLDLRDLKVAVMIPPSMVSRWKLAPCQKRNEHL